MASLSENNYILSTPEVEALKSSAAKIETCGEEALNSQKVFNDAIAKTELIKWITETTDGKKIANVFERNMIQLKSLGDAIIEMSNVIKDYAKKAEVDNTTL